jgi:hypothetical protein
MNNDMRFFFNEIEWIEVLRILFHCMVYEDIFNSIEKLDLLRNRYVQLHQS